MSFNRRKVGLLAGAQFFVMTALSSIALGQDRSSSGFNAADFRLFSPSQRASTSQPSTNESIKLKSSAFTPVHDTTSFPDACKKGFAKQIGERSFELANPGQPYQATDVITQNPRLPWRRLILGGSAPDRCIVYYEKGGIATTRAVVVIDISRPSGPAFVWGGIGGEDPHDLVSLVSQITDAKFQPGGPYSW
jgi:hypothetical protein